MRRIFLLCLFSTGMLLPNTSAGDKKSVPRTLVDDAQMLAGKEWISDEKVSIAFSKKNDPKAKLTIQFVPNKGKPSGKATLGMWAELEGGGGGLSISDYTFELIEDGPVRAMKLFLPNAKVNGRPTMTVPRVLHYKVDGEKLRISQPRLPGWTIEPAGFDFKRSK